MKKNIIIAAAVLVLIVTSWFVLHLKDRNSDGTLELSGTIEVTEVNVGFKTPGRVNQLLVEEGGRVKAGERLAMLDRAEFQSIVEQNRAVLANAAAELDKAKKDYDRYQSLSESGAITSQQLDGATKGYRSAQAYVEQARAALRTSEVRLSDLSIGSPVSGIVLGRNVEAGETVAAGTAVYVLGDLDHPWVKVYVNEKKLGRIHLGQNAQVFTDTYPGKAYAGRITYIASEAEFTPKNVQTKEERVKLVFGVKVSVMNENYELKPGMPADVRIVLK